MLIGFLYLDISIVSFFGVKFIKLFRQEKELIKEKYKGIRPAPGYPACPDHTEKETIFEILDATKNTGVELTESLAMTPTASVSGWFFGNEQAKYFGIGKIEKDQVESLANRKAKDYAVMEKWLSPNLNE